MKMKSFCLKDSLKRRKVNDKKLAKERATNGVEKYSVGEEADLKH